MAEPATVATTTAVSASALTVLGLSTGLPPDLILPSFCGALWALRTLEPAGVYGRAGQVIAGTLLAAWSSPALSQLVAAIPPGINVDLIRFPVAAVVGWGGLRHGLPRIERILRGEEPK